MKASHTDRSYLTRQSSPKRRDFLLGRLLVTVNKKLSFYDLAMNYGRKKLLNFTFQQVTLVLGCG